jgi:membrane-associated phospholipid phosphatase
MTYRNSNGRPHAARTGPLRGALLSLALLVALVPTSQAGTCFGSRIDRVVSYDDSGVWNADVYRNLYYTLALAGVGGALWEGSESRFGKTLWQGIDAQIAAALASGVAKATFTRVRPINSGGDSCLWFEGGANYSFPSNEAAMAVALVGPVVSEYASQYPAAYGLLALPLYIGVARIKNQAHWQSDVLAGWAIGGLSSWLAGSLDTPITIQLLPGGFALGFKTQF